MSEISFLGSPRQIYHINFCYGLFLLPELRLTLMLLYLYMIIYALGVLYWMLSTVDI